MFSIILVALGIVGLSVGSQSVKQEWGISAMLAFGAAGILVTLLVPFGGVIVLVASGAVHKTVQNRRMDRIADEANAEFQRAQTLEKNPGAWHGGTPVQAPVVSQNPYEPPKT